MSATRPGAGTVAWGPARLPDLAALWAAAAEEPLSLGELRRTIGTGDGVVLADADGRGAVAAITRQSGDRVIGHVRLLAVLPEFRRQGVARSLLAAAEEWLADRGAGEVRMGGDIPRYLWPGIDVTDLAMQSVALAAGYRPGGCALNLAMPTSFRADPPAGITVALVGAAADGAAAAAVRALVAEHWPVWGTEVDLALRAGTLAAAVVADGLSGGAAGGPAGGAAGELTGGSAPVPRVVGCCAHSTLREGWIGPMATDPAYAGRGVAAATLAACCADLAGRGLPRAEVAWVGPLSWFADRGAVTSRVFRSYAKPL